MGNKQAKQRSHSKYLMFGMNGAGKTQILYKLKKSGATIMGTHLGGRCHAEEIKHLGCTLQIYDISWLCFLYALYHPAVLAKIDFTQLGMTDVSEGFKLSLTKELSKYRPASQLFDNVDGIIFVIDCADIYKLRHNQQDVNDYARGISKFMSEKSGEQLQIDFNLAMMHRLLVTAYCHSYKQQHQIEIPSVVIDICIAYISYPTHPSQHTVQDFIHHVLAMPSLRNVPWLFWCNKQDEVHAIASGPAMGILDAKHLMRGRMWAPQMCCAHTDDGLREGLKFLYNATRGNFRGIPSYIMDDWEDVDASMM